jgi:DNA-binding CsgD family transcriptional regulator
MRRVILVYGVLLAVLALLLQWWDYRLMIHSIRMEVYIAVIATFCTALGVWAGLKFTGKEAQTSSPKADPARFEISEREYQVLELMAQGYSNQEIADRLFISINTVKTHSSNLFSKLQVQRRTQAVSEARRLRLI